MKFFHSMSLKLNKILQDSVGEIDKIRNNVLRASIGEIHNSLSIREENSRLISFSYVWLSGVLESFFKNTNKEIFNYINSLSLSHESVSENLFIACLGDELNSMQDTRGMKKWISKIVLFSKINSKEITVFLDESYIPYDKKTIRSEHIKLMWEFYGFSGNSLPNPRYHLVLEDLANGRNDVAHGEIDPLSFGRSKRIGQVLRIINDVEEIILHINIFSEEYLVCKKFILN